MFRKEIQGLGRVVSEKGVSLTPENMKSVVEWPIPNNRKEVETFLGYMNYHLKDFMILQSQKVHFCGERHRITVSIP